jgi:hypothetical protein
MLGQKIMRHDWFETARQWVKELDMTTLKRELRNIDEADSLGTILLSSGLILGSILVLVLWATRSAYL